MSTQDRSYTERLLREEGAWWNRLLVGIRRIYGWNLRRLNPGFTLDVGCGLGRNLNYLRGNAIGVDHNPDSVAACRARGLRAYTPDQFERSEYAAGARFRTLLLSHVVEHMTFEDAVSLVARYLPHVEPGGQVIVLTPQEYGYRADPTHVEYFDFDKVAALFDRVAIEPLKRSSFPLPRIAGHLFRHNEFVTVGTRKEDLES